MKVAGVHRRSLWLADDGWAVNVIDQTRLPHELAVARLGEMGDACRAIRDMQVRGAPLIGVTAAYGLCLALRRDPSDAALAAAAAALADTRPTAVNLRWALEQMRRALAGLAPGARTSAGYARAAALCEEEVATCRAIGQHGLPLVRAAWQRAGGGRPVNVLTHCNAGWLATVDFGTALAPVYAAHDAGLPVHVWVAETRPRNQGMLTAWELGQHGVPHTIVADNAVGHLMQRGLVDLCLVGTDRTTAAGDVGNKVGTYLRALAAREHGVPFHVALPGSSIDWSIRDGLAEIPIEERAAAEVTSVAGRLLDGAPATASVALAPEGSPARNPAFDVTPARLVTGFVTERGTCAAGAEALAALYGRAAA